MKRMEIEALLKWAYCEELPKADAEMKGAEHVPSGWSAVSTYAQLLTVIDDNRYGVLPALSIEPGDPHPEAIAVHDGDVVLVPKGHHPYGSPYGYETYYLNVMAGPLRKWRFKNHPDHEWIVERDAKASS